MLDHLRKYPFVNEDAFTQAVEYMLDMQKSAAQRLVSSEYIDMIRIERICDRLGVHPVEIYGDTYLNAVLAVAERKETRYAKQLAGQRARYAAQRKEQRA